jgi:hypothetical protein
MLGLNLTKEPRAIREAKEEQTIALVTRLLRRRLGQDLPEETQSRLSQLSLPALENLSVGVACALRIALSGLTQVPRI